MDAMTGSWMRAGSLVSQDAVDDVQELLKKGNLEGGRRRSRKNSDPALPSLAEELFSFPAKVGASYGRPSFGDRRRAGRERRSGASAVAVRMLGRLIDDSHRDRLRACLADWARVTAQQKADLVGWSSRSSNAPACSRGASAPSASSSRARCVAVADGVLRLGLPTLLPLAFGAWRVQMLVRAAEAERQHRLRHSHVSRITGQLARWFAARSGLELLLLFRGWCGCCLRYLPVIETRRPEQATEALRLRGVAATSALERRDRLWLLHDCLMRWRTFSAEGLAVQVLVMRERLERADAECCVLRGEDGQLRAEAEHWRTKAEEENAKRTWAEEELLRRSRQEFAQLREVEMEIAKMRADAVASTVPSIHVDTPTAAAYIAGRAAVASARTPQAVARAAKGMAISFSTSAVRTWVRLYLTAWRAVIGISDMVLAIADTSAALDTAILAGRTFASWRRAIEHSLFRAASVRLADAVHRQHVISICHAALRSWHACIDRISQLVTPLSFRGSEPGNGSCLGSTFSDGVTYHSAVARSLERSLGDSELDDASRTLLEGSPTSLWFGAPRIASLAEGMAASAHGEQGSPVAAVSGSCGEDAASVWLECAPLPPRTPPEPPPVCQFFKEAPDQPWPLAEAQKQLVDNTASINGGGYPQIWVPRLLGDAHQPLEHDPGQHLWSRQQ